MHIVYCNETDIRNLTGLTASEISDALISGIITHAATLLNADIQVKWEDERVVAISNEKENPVDGSNIVFYTRHFPIGDKNDNMTVCGIDVYAYVLDSDGTRTEHMVSGIVDDELGKIELFTAPASGRELFFTYYSAPISVELPHPLIKLAAIQRAAALCYTRIDASKVSSFRVGKISVMKQSDAYNIYMNQYYNTLTRIKKQLLLREEKDYEV